jgi:hypothetical protein
LTLNSSPVAPTRPAATVTNLAPKIFMVSLQSFANYARRPEGPTPRKVT